MKRATVLLLAILFMFGIGLAVPSPAAAQPIVQDLSITTTYPSQVVQLGESSSISIQVRATDVAQTVTLSMKETPDGWNATFRGGGHIIQSVFVEADAPASVDLHLDPPKNPTSGTYTFVVLAESSQYKSELPITLIVQDKVPSSLSFVSDLPTIKGAPTASFKYTATLKNEGDQDLTVDLTADPPSGFLTKFTVSGQDVTSFPVSANGSKSVTIELTPIGDASAGSHPFTVYANGGGLQAVLDLTAEVFGQQALKVAGPDGLLSGRANAGKESTLQVVVQNTGTAAAQGVELSASPPSGWTVTFDPQVIPEIPAGQQVEVKAALKPSDKAVAGDYTVTISAKPADGATKSADFRITVTTSTLWGVAGIGLIAIAVGVVALAVVRFGRR